MQPLINPNTLQSKADLLQRMRVLKACPEALDWVFAQYGTAEEIWNKCENLEWKAWFLVRNLDAFVLYVNVQLQRSPLTLSPDVASGLREFLRSWCRLNNCVTMPFSAMQFPVRLEEEENLTLESEWTPFWETAKRAAETLRTWPRWKREALFELTYGCVEVSKTGLVTFKLEQAIDD